MCFASLHVANRKATNTETLTVQSIPQFSGWKGLYSTAKGDDVTKLVCLTGQKKAVIKQVRFEGGMPQGVSAAWEGKRRVEVTLYNQNHGMWARFADGTVVNLSSLKAGLAVNIGVPFAVRVRKPKAIKTTGMDVIERSLDEATKLPAPATKKVDADA